MSDVSLEGKGGTLHEDALSVMGCFRWLEHKIVRVGNSALAACATLRRPMYP